MTRYRQPSRPNLRARRALIPPASRSALVSAAVARRPAHDAWHARLRDRETAGEQRAGRAVLGVLVLGAAAGVTTVGSGIVLVVAGLVS